MPRVPRRAALPIARMRVKSWLCLTSGTTSGGTRAMDIGGYQPVVDRCIAQQGQ